MLKMHKITHDRIFRSQDYNFNFEYATGRFARWGKTLEDNPRWSPYGPEIADIEITTKCGQGCKYCYKGNTAAGKNMSLAMFQRLIEKINVGNTLTQVAFGLGSTGEENPELWDMCRYLRSKFIVPNGTVANISEETAGKITSLFGACAVSYHGDKNMCYDSVERLTSRGLIQTNIHLVIHEDNYAETLEIFDDILTDPRLKGLNAIVLLSLKTKGRAAENNFKQLSQHKFNGLVGRLIETSISFGMDSCSSHKYIKFLNSTKLVTPEVKQLQLQCIEPCESFAIFSSYFNVDGLYYPCSFAEGCVAGIDVFKHQNFVQDVWNGLMCNSRDKSIKCGRECLLYNI